jgi:hypothetical protein
MRALVHTAVDVIEEALKGGDQKAAVEVLKISSYMARYVHQEGQ